MPEKGTNLNRFTADASAALGGPRWMAGRRALAYDRFVAVGMPSETEEVWRYSGIDGLDLDRFSPPAPGGDGTGASTDGSAQALRDLELAREVARGVGPHSQFVVTRDGAVISPVAQSPGSPGLSVRSARSLSGSTAPEGFGEIGSPRDAFGELHEAFATDAVVLTFEDEAPRCDPVVVVHLLSRGGARSSFPHTVVRAGSGSNAGVIELFVSVDPVDDTSDRQTSSQGGGLVVPVTELDVREGARLRYADVQLLDDAATRIALQASRVLRDGLLEAFTVSLGCAYSRIRTDSDLVGEASRSTLLAAYLGTGQQVHDFRTLQEHHGPRSKSELLFKGAVADSSRSVYSGLIRIARGARRSDALQTNHNLVLSEGAQADSVPNLDIDENDVRCSHASTVGPIDQEQLYYLESRGVDPESAERLIVRGFFSDMAGRAPFAQLGDLLEREVAARLRQSSHRLSLMAAGNG